LTRIQFDEAPPSFLAITSDARLVAAADFDRPEVWVWDAASGELLNTFEGPKGDGYGGLAFSPDGKYLATHGHASSVLLWDLDAVPALKKARAPKLPEALHEPEPEKLTAEQLDRLWDDLASDDGAAAFKAIWGLALRPRQALPLLRQRLRPLTPPTAADLARLVADLEGDFDTRERASAELARSARAVAKELRQALDKAEGPETRRRLGELVKGLGPPVTLGPALRGIRAVEALEYMGGDDSKALLREVAKGHPDALETAEARLALDRLARRRPAP
jgi:hypothetical protein